MVEGREGGGTKRSAAFFFQPTHSTLTQDPTALGMPPRAGSAGPGGPPMPLPAGVGMGGGMNGGLAPPPDPTLTTVFVGNLAERGGRRTARRVRPPGRD